MALDLTALTRYRGLALDVRRGMGERPGDRRFPGRPQPSGVEVEAYSAYTPGDDLRHLDWSSLARLDALLVRRFTAEREVCVHLVVDLSASMAVPVRDDKLGTACELAMALAFIALASGDAVRLVLLPGDGAPRLSPVYRQRASVSRVAERLSAAHPGGALGLGTALEAYARRSRRPGMAVVISDLMVDAAEVAQGVQALRARRFEVVLLHVIGPSELDPDRDFSRGVLRDVESGDTHPMALTPTTRARYQDVLRTHLDALEALAARAAARYARLPSDGRVATFVTTDLARLGVVRSRR